MRARWFYFLTICWGLLSPTQGAEEPGSFATSTPVGQLGSNLYSTPVNQLLTPTGRQLELTSLRPQALALSPNGHLLAVAGKTHELVILDPITASLKQRLPLPAQDDKEAGVTSTPIFEPGTEAPLSYTGNIFSPGGARSFFLSGNSSIKGVS